MNRIIVGIAGKGEKWKLHWKGYGKHFVRADTLFAGIERRLSGSRKTEKLAIRIKVGRDTTNESLSSSSREYLLYTLGCFLEEHLSKLTLKRIKKKYGNYKI